MRCRFHRLRVHLVESDAARGRHCDRKAADAGDRERQSAEDCGEAPAAVAVQPRAGRLLGQPGLSDQASEQPLGQTERGEGVSKPDRAPFAAEPDEARIERFGGETRDERDDQQVARADVAREVEHPRPGETRVGEEEVAAPRGDLPTVADDPEACVRNRNSGEIGERIRPGLDRGQRRARFNDRMAERTGEPVTVPGRARLGIRRPARRKHHGTGAPQSPGDADHKFVVGPFDRAYPRAAYDPDAALAAGGAQGVEHLVGPVGDGKDLAVGACFKGNAAIGEPRRERRVREGAERVAEEPAVIAVPAEERGEVALVRQVRLARTRKEELTSRLGHPFEHDDLAIGR